MKVIDLLNKIANGEEVPKKIEYMGYSFEYDTNHKRYESYFDEQIWTLHDFVNVDDNLNDIVEILEEDIEKVEIPTLDNMKDIGTKVGRAYRELFEGFNKGWNKPLEEEKKIPEKIKDKYCSQISKVELAQKYNEIIDYLDYLKSKGDE